MILCIDANENLLEGDFVDMTKQLGLVNAHQKYGDAALPPTHGRGSTPISGMFVSPSLTPSRVGILAHGTGVMGDHRNMFLDFDEEMVMGSALHQILPLQQRRLQLYDARITRRFNNACDTHFRENRIQEKTEKLYSRATYPPA